RRLRLQHHGLLTQFPDRSVILRFRLVLPEPKDLNFYLPKLAGAHLVSSYRCPRGYRRGIVACLRTWLSSLRRPPYRLPLLLCRIWRFLTWGPSRSVVYTL